MKQRAKKHLEIALGGNMNISSLKPLALIEIMTDFAKKEVEAINYTHCCKSDSEQLGLERKAYYAGWTHRDLDIGGNFEKWKKSKECPMCNEEKDCQGHTVCEDCGGRSF